MLFQQRLRALHTLARDGDTSSATSGATLTKSWRCRPSHFRSKLQVVPGYGSEYSDKVWVILSFWGPAESIEEIPHILQWILKWTVQGSSLASPSSCQPSPNLCLFSNQWLLATWIKCSDIIGFLLMLLILIKIMYIDNIDYIYMGFYMPAVSSFQLEHL